MRTLGSMIVPARYTELRRVLADVSSEDMSALDATIAVGMDRALGRELLAARLPVAESVFVCLLNLEPAGLMVLHRSDIAAHLRALVVTPDMRRKGVARTLLIEAEQRALDRKLDWLWMRLLSANSEAILCARSAGFRRYNPQFFSRTYGRPVSAGGIHVGLESLRGSQTEQTIGYWLGVEATEGDAWAQPLIERELTPLCIPEGGEAWRVLANNEEVGAAHLAYLDEQPMVTLWLDPLSWSKPTEFACLRAVLNTLTRKTAQLGVRVGSSGHLRKSLDAYKELGFQTMLDEQVILIKRLIAPEE